MQTADAGRRAPRTVASRLPWQWRLRIIDTHAALAHSRHFPDAIAVQTHHGDTPREATLPRPTRLTWCASVVSLLRRSAIGVRGGCHSAKDATGTQNFDFRLPLSAQSTTLAANKVGGASHCGSTRIPTAVGSHLFVAGRVTSDMDVQRADVRRGR